VAPADPGGGATRVYLDGSACGLSYDASLTRSNCASPKRLWLYAARSLSARHALSCPGCLAPGYALGGIAIRACSPPAAHTAGRVER
jgi:hypothetical protein